VFVAIAAVISISSHGGLVLAENDDNLDDAVDVESEDTMVVAEDEVEEETTKSAEVNTTVLFIEPTHVSLTSLELPGGAPVEFLVGFTNRGEADYVVESLEASFHYPMDFNFVIQNFSKIAYNKIVKPEQEATLSYTFIPSESFAGRPFGLSINLNYRDANGASFIEAVYNETVQIIEIDEGLDGETVFLYIFLAACVVLALVGGQQLLSSLGRKSRSSHSRKTVDMGNSNPNNVDYDWLPKETLRLNNKSPKTPRQSPRQRKTKRSAGDSD